MSDMQPKFYGPAERAVFVAGTPFSTLHVKALQIWLLYYFKVDKLHNAVLSPHKMSDTIQTLPPNTEGLPSTRCLYCWDRRSVLHRLQSVNLTSVTSAQSTNECLLASVIALVGSWKILLHTPLDPPTARTAASNLAERWQVAQEGAVLFHNKASNQHEFDRADTPWEIMTSWLRWKLN